MFQRSSRDGGDLVDFSVERARLWLCFAEQLRRGHDSFAHGGAGASPGLVELTGLARGPRLFGEGLGHAPAMLPVDARGRHEVTHGQRGGNLAVAHQLLHRLGQGLHQGQATGHPVPAAVEAAREFFDRVTQTALHLFEQPALFQRALRFAAAQGALQDQRVGFAHRPHHRLDRVAAELLKRGDTLVAVDDQIPAAGFDDDDGRLLAVFSQRGHQPALTRRMSHPQVFQAAVELMKLQSRHRFGFQYAPARNGSSAGFGEVRRKAKWNQSDKPVLVFRSAEE